VHHVLSAPLPLRPPPAAAAKQVKDVCHAAAAAAAAHTLLCCILSVLAGQGAYMLSAFDLLRQCTVRAMLHKTHT
jgi:hypothetical protein